MMEDGWMIDDGQRTIDAGRVVADGPSSVVKREANVLNGSAHLVSRFSL